MDDVRSSLRLIGRHTEEIPSFHYPTSDRDVSNYTQIMGELGRPGSNCCLCDGKQGSKLSFL